ADQGDVTGAEGAIPEKLEELRALLGRKITGQPRHIALHLTPPRRSNFCCLLPCLIRILPAQFIKLIGAELRYQCLLHRARKASDRGSKIDGLRCKLDAEAGLYSAHELRADQRVATKLEEVVFDSDLHDPKEALPDLDECVLRVAFGGDIGGVERGPRMSGRRRWPALVVLDIHARQITILGIQIVGRANHHLRKPARQRATKHLNPFVRQYAALSKIGFLEIP